MTKIMPVCLKFHGHNNIIIVGVTVSVEIVLLWRECICCCEVEKVVMKKEESASEISCITEHEGFESVCLNAWVPPFKIYGN